MYKCQLTGSFNRCQYRSSISGELYCTARYAGCGFRTEVKKPDADRPGMKYSILEQPGKSGPGEPGPGGSGSGGYRPGEPEPEHGMPGNLLPSSYVRKPRWYESYYPDSRPVK